MWIKSFEAETRVAAVRVHASTQWPYKGKACCLLDNTASPFWSLVSSFSSLTRLQFPSLPHTHSLFFLSFFTLHVSLFLSPMSAFLHQATGFTPATSILRVMAVVAHKAWTLHCWCGQMCHSSLAQPSVPLVLTGSVIVYPGARSPIVTLLLMLHCGGV